MKKEESYRELLKDPRWIKRRNEILSRDNNTCQFCGCQDKYMHVHHKQYREGCLPWEYPDNMLVTLCEDCHNWVHLNRNIHNIDVRVGQVFRHEHSDWVNTAIIYKVDYENKLIFTLECDEGSSCEEIYDNCETYDYFCKHYDAVNCNEYETIYLFESWFLYISDHLEQTPWAFRYNYGIILKENPYLQYILNNRVQYEYRY